MIRREYARLLGYPPGKRLEGAVGARARQALDWYRDHGRPRVTVKVGVGGIVAAITAGEELDREAAHLWASERVDEAYFLDRLGAAVVEVLANALGPRRSPGTGDMPIEEQWTIFEQLAPLAPGIELLSSGMLTPKNSLLAVYPLAGRADGNPCARCDLSGCRFRRRAA